MYLLRKSIVFLIIGLLAIFAVPQVVAAEEEIDITIKNNRFEPSEIKVKAGVKIKLKVTNSDPTMEEFESHSLNKEKMIHPGKTVTITIGPLKPGVYDFFGEFHPDTAKGKIIVE